MFGFLKDKRDINQVIFDIAEHRRPQDQQRLLELLRGRELFAAVESSRVPFEHGQHIVAGADDDIQLKTGAFPDGRVCAVFYVDRADARLGPKYVGLSASAAFEMVSKMPVDSLLIQNVRDSWVGFPRQELAALRAKYL